MDENGQRLVPRGEHSPIRAFAAQMGSTSTVLSRNRNFRSYERILVNKTVLESYDIALVSSAQDLGVRMRNKGSIARFSRALLFEPKKWVGTHFFPAHLGLSTSST